MEQVSDPIRTTPAGKITLWAILLCLVVGFILPVTVMPLICARESRDCCHPTQGGNTCPEACCVGVVASPEVTFSMPAPEQAQAVVFENPVSPVFVPAEPVIRPPIFLT